ncbi:hypothetical protein ACFPYI_17890 [Halomarina salina]|uniref:Rpa-associated protein n=1 Tax=Halomarina salina TaxID=1872699 RepID=A0ABD5RRY2_9EURY
MSSTPGNREVAYRLFAAEFEEASYSYSESDEERAPNYVVTPTGARVNRLFAAGVLTEVAQAGDSILRARVVDPTGAFVVYAGQYQPEAMSFLDDAETPSFVAVTGKARTFQPEDSDLVYTSVRPETVSEVDAPTRDRWTVTAAKRTLERIGVFAAALETGLTGDTLATALREAGVDASLAAGIPIAIEQYGTTTAYLAALQEVALDAVRRVAGETDEVRELDISPGEGGDESFTPAIPADVDVSVAAAGVADSASPEGSADGSAPESGTPEPAAATDEPDATGDPVEEPSSEPVEEGVDAGEEPAGEPVAEEESSAPSASDESAAAESPSAEAAPSGAEPTEAEPSGTTPTGTEPTEAEPTEAEETVADAAETVDPDTEYEDDGTEPVEAPEADEESTEEPSFEEPEPESGDADAGAYEMDEETREEVESEFGTDFSTGNEVDPAGEADIETPDADDLDEPASESDESAVAETGSEATPASEPDEPSFEPASDDEATDVDATASGSEPEPASETEPASEAEPKTEPEPETDAGDTEPADESDADAEADADLDTVLVEEMKALDDGDGAPREELVARVGDRTGADESTVDDAIQDALMSGQCYEPEDGRLKPI